MSSEFNKREYVDVKYVFTEDELDTLRLKHVNELIELQKLEKQIEDLKESLKPKMKELTISTDTRLLTIRDGYQYISRECELRPNHTTGKMEFWDILDGEVVFTRDLYSNENQLTLSSSKLA
jgi:hypothetical protein